jgi:hypothetical protein
LGKYLAIIIFSFTALLYPVLELWISVRALDVATGQEALVQLCFPSPCFAVGVFIPVFTLTDLLVWSCGIFIPKWFVFVCPLCLFSSASSAS